MKSILSAWKKTEWQDRFFICALFFFSIVYAILFLSFNQFPSEYYGGDHYAHFASVMKIYNTGNPFISAQYAGELQHYPWLTPFVMAVAARIFFLDPFVVAIFFPIFILIATMVVTYSFGKKYFQSKTWALFLSLFWVVQLVPSFHPSDTAKQLMIPLLGIFVLMLSQKMRKKEAIIAGIIYGISGLQHVVTFFVATVVLVITICFACLHILKKEERREQLKKGVLVACIGIFCAALFWLPLVIKYGGETQNQWQLYSAASLYPSADIIAGVFREVLGFGLGWKVLGYCLFFLLFVFFGIKKRDNRIFIPLFLFVAGLLGIIHPYLTYPLFGVSLGYYRFPIVFVFVAKCIFVTGIFYFWREICLPFIQNYSSKKQSSIKSAIKGVVLSLFFLWIIFSFGILLKTYTTEERYNYAVEDSIVIDGYRSVEKFIEEAERAENITEGDVFLTTHPDVGFLFNGMTGKSVMLTRITHANPFVDYNKRAADMAVILYGSNRTKAEELIKEYGVTYLFFESASLDFRNLCLQKWDKTKSSKKNDETTLVYWCLQTDPVYERYMKENGIETQRAAVRLAAGDKDVPLTTVLAIKPEKIRLETELIFAYKDLDGINVVELYQITRMVS